MRPTSLLGKAGRRRAVPVERIYTNQLCDVRPDHLERYIFAGTRVGGSRVLDAACGCGYGTHILRTAGCEVTGVDIEPEAISYAEKNWPGATYIMQDVCDPLTGSYDAVVSFETLEHLIEPTTALQNFAKIAPTLICSVPNEINYPFHKSRFSGDKYPHIKHYTPDELHFLLNEAGYTIASRWCQKTKHSPVEDGTDGMFLIYVARHLGRRD